MNRLKHVFDNLDLEVATNEPNEKEGETGSGHVRCDRASSVACIEGRLKGDSCDNINGNAANPGSSLRGETNSRRGVRPKRRSTSGCLRHLTSLGSNQNSASSNDSDFTNAFPALDRPRNIKRLDSNDSFPDYVGALGARYLAIQAAADAAKELDELCDSDHLAPEEGLHQSTDLPESFVSVQPKEAHLRRSKNLGMFKQNRSDDNPENTTHTTDSGYESSSSLGSVGDLILKALATAGTALENETTAATTAATNTRPRRGGRRSVSIQQQNIPSIAPMAQGFAKRGSAYCEEIIYRRRSSRFKNDVADDSSDDDDEINPKANSSPSKTKTSRKPSSRRNSHRSAAIKANKDMSSSASQAGNGGNTARGQGEAQQQLDIPRAISDADRCDSFKTLASIEAGMKRNRFTPM
jgi:hypothetical protein